LDFLKELQRKLAHIIDGTKVYSGCAPVFFDFLQLDEDKKWRRIGFHRATIANRRFHKSLGIGEACELA
jgi:hypothetical protein